MIKRTDLALEAKEIWQESAGETARLDGVSAEEETINGFKVTTVRVLNDSGARALSKPVGTYITVELGSFIRREEDAFTRGAECIAQALCKLNALDNNDTVLVAGLGNEAITPDAVGPEAVKHTLVTWHLTERMADIFGSFRRVAAVQTGVLGTTGVESADVISALSDKIKTDCVIVIDALASRSISRLCSTVQISDTGIIPGSGVGSGRNALSSETLGVKVIAVGIPTVVDAATLTADMMEKVSLTPDEDKLREFSGGLIVTPKEIDLRVREIAKLTAYGINMALHSGITVNDLTMLLE